MEAQIQTVFSEKFEQIKARFKLRNTELARMAGVSDAAINKIMTGRTESPDVRTLITLGKKLNLSADWILFNEGPMVKEDAPDGSLKKGIQVRDEMISQLQKELWGKPEGVIFDRPLSEMGFETLYQHYLATVQGQLDSVPFFFGPLSAKLVAPRSI